MTKLRNLFIKLFLSGKSYTKVIFVFIAFFLMVLSSCLIMNNTLNRKLLEHAEESIYDVQALLENVLAEPKVVLGFMADDIQYLIERGDDFEAVQAYMRERSSDTFKGRIQNFTFYSIFGHFDVFDEFYDGGGFVPPSDFDPQERPWYIAAVEAGGNVAISPVYVDADSNTPVVAYTRCLFDSDGTLLGVVSIDVPVSFLIQFLTSKITESSYGFIVDDQSIVIAHPSEAFVGAYLVEGSSEIAALMYDIRDQDGITRRNFTSYTGARSILFSSETTFGWYVNFVVPEFEYYRDLYYMMVFVSILGFLMASLLSLLLISIEAARSRSEQRNKQKSSFLATMSHEIRTPMNSIIGFSELALDDDVSSKTKQYLVNISDNAKWLLNIINDILDTSKIESGNLVLEHIPYDLQDVISQCQSAILPKALEKGLMLYCYAEPIDDKMLVGDPVRLRQVFMNLLSNAVKFTDTGTVKLLASLSSLDDDYAIIQFEVKDSGIGMSPDQVAHVFEPFMQADDTVTRKYGGTGLGLSITKNIIELMGGKLRVESELGAGSKFSFSLAFDLTDSEASRPPGVAVISDVERPVFSGEILVCEDNGLNQQVVCEHLARVGLKSVVAFNGKEGVDIATERHNNGKPFDLILMDIHMPIMDGLEAANRIAEIGVKTPVVALTANIMSNDLELYKANGMSDYLGKPFTSQELWRCLIKYLPVMSVSTVVAHDESSKKEEFLKKLQIYFLKSNRDVIEKITQALDEDDIKLAHRITHTLKSNAAQIGEWRLQEASSSVEQCLKENDVPGAKMQIDFLKLELHMVFDELTPLLIEEAESVRVEITDDEKIRKILKVVEPLLIDNNPECMDFVDDIRAIPGAENIANYIEDFSFEQALVELGKFRKKSDEAS